MDTPSPQSPAPQQAPQPQATSKRTESRAFYIYLFVWAGSLLFNILIEFTARLLGLNGTTMKIINIISLLCGFYFLFGWVPVIAVYQRDKRRSLEG